MLLTCWLCLVSANASVEVTKAKNAKAALSVANTRKTRTRKKRSISRLRSMAQRQVRLAVPAIYENVDHYLRMNDFALLRTGQTTNRWVCF